MFEGIIALGVAIVGVIIWSVRQEGRINEHDTRFEAREKIAVIEQKLTDERHDDLKARLLRIEQKLDKLAQ